jgi:DNA-binding LacI/PurR family transcriptional regulator
MTATNALERFQAFQETLAEHRLDFQSEWVADGDFEEEGGYRAAQKILASVRRPSAILCANDLMAIGAIRALKMKGSNVPEHISVVGFDDMEEAIYHQPALTTVSFSAYQMGRLAAQKMSQIMVEETIEQRATTLQSELIVRESTGRAV